MTGSVDGSRESDVCLGLELFWFLFWSCMDEGVCYVLGLKS